MGIQIPPDCPVCRDYGADPHCEECHRPPIDLSPIPPRVPGKSRCSSCGGKKWVKPGPPMGRGETGFGGELVTCRKSDPEARPCPSCKGSGVWWPVLFLLCVGGAIALDGGL